MYFVLRLAQSHVRCESGKFGPDASLMRIGDGGQRRDINFPHESHHGTPMPWAEAVDALPSVRFNNNATYSAVKGWRPSRLKHFLRRVPDDVDCRRLSSVVSEGSFAVERGDPHSVYRTSANLRKAETTCQFSLCITAVCTMQFARRKCRLSIHGTIQPVTKRMSAPEGRAVFRRNSHSCLLPVGRA